MVYRFLLVVGLVGFIVLLGGLTPAVLAQDTVPTLVFATNTPALSPTSPDDDYLRSERLGITFIGSADIPYDETRYTRALELGAGWNRFPVYWDRVETEPGRYTWDAFDRAVMHDIQHGLRTNLILLGAPAFRRENNGEDNGRVANLSAPIFADGTDIPGTVDAPKPINADNGWAAFVSAAVNRYRPGGELAQAHGWRDDQGVTVWEIWNEPDYPGFWNGSVRDYARLLKIAYLVTHQIEPDATVMFGGLTYGTEQNWLAQVLGIYLDDPLHEQYDWYMDAVAVHNYGGSWRSGWLVRYAQRTFIEYGIDKPVWLNESGLPAWDDYPGPTWAADAPGLRVLRGTQEQQAAFFVQSSAWAFAEGADVVFYHQLYDDCGDQPAGSDFPPHDGSLCEDGTVCFGDAFGIYRNPPGSVCYAQHPEPDTARPVADAYKLVAEIFGNAPLGKYGAAQERFDAGVNVIAFARPGRNERVVVVWNTELDDTEFTFEALGERATAYTLNGETTITAQDGVFTLALPGGKPDNNPNARDWEKTSIGGDPVILVEQISPAAAQELLLETGAASPIRTPEPTSMPGSNLSDEQVADLIDASPSGVVFVSLNISRIRTRPDTTAESRVLGNINPGQAASVIGRTPDEAWLLLDFNEREVWVAAFLGEVYASDDDLATLRTVPYPTPSAPTVPPPASPTSTAEAG